MAARRLHIPLVSRQRPSFARRSEVSEVEFTIMALSTEILRVVDVDPYEFAAVNVNVIAGEVSISPVPERMPVS